MEPNVKDECLWLSFALLVCVYLCKSIGNLKKKKQLVFATGGELIKHLERSEKRKKMNLLLLSDNIS